ncbi:hypothetical protein T07_6981 [Trichinella nelsoni]|uniref:Uncharacterized protein n=1 Tax=Trichinella nelsoni TaxID=6336 RepID=A0A0V0SIT9_9BILA|nr:hypothetical protein T07_6981 [Trichinella nelsoni]
MYIVAFLPFVHHCESGRFPRTTTFIQLDEMTRYTNLTVDMRLLHHSTRISILGTVKGSPFKITFGMESAFGMESYILPQSLLECTVTEEDIQSSLAKMNPVIKQSVTRRKNMDVENTPQMVKRVPHTNVKHSSTFKRQLLLELEGLQC